MRDEFWKLTGLALERWSLRASQADEAALEAVFRSPALNTLDWHHLQVAIFVVRRTKDDRVREVIRGLIGSSNIAVSTAAMDAVREWDG